MFLLLTRYHYWSDNIIYIHNIIIYIYNIVYTIYIYDKLCTAMVEKRYTGSSDKHG